MSYRFTFPKTHAKRKTPKVYDRRNLEPLTLEDHFEDFPELYSCDKCDREAEYFVKPSEWSEPQILCATHYALVM